MLDRTVIINLMGPTCCKTFKDSTTCRSPSEEGWLMRYRMDTCNEYSLKVLAKTQWDKWISKWLLRMWAPYICCEFLSETRNKANPFPFRFMHIVKPCKNVQTGDHNMPNKNVLRTNIQHVSPLAPCNHTEADARLFVYDGYALKEG